MPILTKLREFLDQKKMAYEVVTHRQAFTAQEVAQAEHVPGKQLAKVVMLRSGKEFFMAVLPAPYRVDLDCAATATGKRDVALATEQEFNGAVSTMRAGCDAAVRQPVQPAGVRRPYAR